MNDRRSTYFIFQGLLTIILLLFYFYRREYIEDWPFRLAVLVTLSGGLLGFLALAPQRWLENPRTQGAWFVIDILLSSAMLYWIQQPTSDLYLAYFLVIFGTAITHSLMQSFLVAFIATALYLYLSWGADSQFQQEFWLRVPFLWIVASFTGLLSRDSSEADKKKEEAYRERLFHLERLAVLGQLTAEIAHRIKSPLTTIRVNAEFLAHQKDIPLKRQGELLRIGKEVDHCKEVLQKLLSLGRVEEVDFEMVDLCEVVKRVLESMKSQLAQCQIKLVTGGLREPEMLRADPALLTEALTAIIQNAIEAMAEGGQLTVHLRREVQRRWWSRKTQAESVKLVIEDTGEGIEASKIETIFRPFFTTKKNRGNGLGLSSALRIIDKHGGTILAESAGRGMGASFILTFPRLHEAERPIVDALAA